MPSRWPAWASRHAGPTLRPVTTPTPPAPPTALTSPGTEPQNGSPATTPLDQLPLPEKGKVYNNPLDRDQIQDGGTLTLPAGEIGPNWNYLSIEGNTQEMHNMWDWYMPTNLFTSDATGSKFEPNPNFVTKAETTDEGGKQVLTLDLNPDAKISKIEFNQA